MIPGMGGLEIVIIALIALVVVGPKELPAMLRKLGRMTARVRGMAQEFRASFEDMARQSELDELRREVEQLRTQHMRPIGDQFDSHLRDINADLATPPIATLEAPTTAPEPVAAEPKPESKPEPQPAAEAPAPAKARRRTKA